MDSFSEKDIKALSQIHHDIYYKLLHINFDEQYPMMKGISPLEMGVLAILSRNPGAMLREIAELLNISKSTLTSVVNRLERRKYVTRLISSKDRRSFELSLTADGKLAQQQHIDSEHDTYVKILSTLDSKEDVEKLISLLRKIADNC